MIWKRKEDMKKYNNLWKLNKIKDNLWKRVIHRLFGSNKTYWFDLQYACLNKLQLFECQ